MVAREGAGWEEAAGKSGDDAGIGGEDARDSCRDLSHARMGITAGGPTACPLPVASCKLQHRRGQHAGATPAHGLPRSEHHAASVAARLATSVRAVLTLAAVTTASHSVLFRLVSMSWTPAPALSSASLPSTLLFWVPPHVHQQACESLAAWVLSADYKPCYLLGQLAAQWPICLHRKHLRRSSS